MRIGELTEEKLKQLAGMTMVIQSNEGGTILPAPTLKNQSGQATCVETLINGQLRTFGPDTEVVFQL